MAKCVAIADILEGNGRYVNQSPKGEPQLGKRGLYASTGGANQARVDHLALLWVLNLSDGKHTLLDIAERAKIAFPLIRAAADALTSAGLLRVAR